MNTDLDIKIEESLKRLTTATELEIIVNYRVKEAVGVLVSKKFAAQSHRIDSVIAKEVESFLKEDRDWMNDNDLDEILQEAATAYIKQLLKNKG